MRSFRILTDGMLLHLAQKPLIVLAVVFLLIVAVTAVLVRRQLRIERAAEETPEPPEENHAAE